MSSVPAGATPNHPSHCALPPSAGGSQGAADHQWFIQALRGEDAPQDTVPGSPEAPQDAMHQMTVTKTEGGFLHIPPEGRVKLSL